MGLTSSNVLLRFPWYSVDSSSIVKASAFGKIYLPRIYQSGGKWEYKYFEGNPFLVSDQRKHKVGIAGSIFACSPAMRKEYEKLIHVYGFELGNIDSSVLRPRRCRKGETRKTHPTLNLSNNITEEKSDDITLAHNYKSRFKFNILYWLHLIERLPKWPHKFDPNNPPEENQNGTVENKTKIHFVVSTKSHLKQIQELSVYPDVLTSYLQVTTSFEEVIKEYKRGG